MNSFIKFSLWVTISTFLLVSLFILAPTIFIALSLKPPSHEPQIINLSGSNIQAEQVYLGEAIWYSGPDNFSPYYEHRLTILGKKIDNNELKLIINNITPNLVHEAHIHDLYEIAPDEILMKVSTGKVSGNIHKMVVVRAKASATGTVWKVYNFERDLDEYPFSIAESKIPGWVEIADRFGPLWIHLIDKNTLLSYSFHGRIVKVDYPYVILSDYKNEYKVSHEPTEPIVIFKVVNMHSGRTESELTLSNKCYSLSEPDSDVWDVDSLNNAWDKYFIFDRKKLSVKFRKQNQLSLMNAAARSSSLCAHLINP